MHKSPHPNSFFLHAPPRSNIMIQRRSEICNLHYIEQTQPNKIHVYDAEVEHEKLIQGVALKSSHYLQQILFSNIRTKDHIDDLGFAAVLDLLDLQQLDIEDQSAVSWNAGLSFASVCEVCWNGKSSLATDSHASDTNIPSLNNFTST